MAKRSLGIPYGPRGGARSHYPDSTPFHPGYGVESNIVQTFTYTCRTQLWIGPALRLGPRLGGASEVHRELEVFVINAVAMLQQCGRQRVSYEGVAVEERGVKGRIHGTQLQRKRLD